ncbi:hypothetical protein KKC44_02385 [Patescibacteria group bacterium]|nr:hypothetical protein [Patescibacteria group bacterium]MBU2259432.1 hypothetical protein [Patescibacteria group bacterium]
MSGKSGKFKFKVSTDFVLTEGVEEGQSDSGGMWSFFNKCYGYANLLVRRDQEGYDMSLGIHPFDMEERFKNISSMRSVNAGKVQMYPQADISIQTDTPVTFDVMFKYKNSDGYNGGGVGRLKTNHYLTAALPIDYDTFIQFTDEAGNTFNSSIYRIPREAHCGTVNLKYVNGQSQWSFCGNRVTEGGEECDDGNKVDGDGCSSECKKEVIAQSETVADDADGYRTFKTSGIGWTSIAGSGYKEQHYAHSPSRFALSKGKVYARWSLFNVEPGTYDLYTTWPSQGSDNVYFGAVEYTRTFGGKRIILKNQKVSQSQLPGGPVWNGVPWQKVGEVDLETGKLVRVYIASLQSEKFAADAVRLVKRGSGIGCLDIQEMEECWEGTSNETCYWDGEENLCSNERKPCHDLDDHEDHFYEPSITYGFEGVSDVSRDGHSDYCGTAGNEAGKLKEYYCKDDYNVGFILHTCPDGCQDGACVDGGDDDDDDDDSDDDDLRATLSIAGKAIGTGDTTVENEKNVNLLRFEARADDAHDILFTRAVFAADEGSLLNGQNYTLWVDTNKDGIVDTILEQGVASQSSKVMFDNLAGGGYIVPDGQTVVFEVHMDVSSSLTGNMIQLQFASGEANYVAAELLEDGSSLQGIETNGSCSVNTCDLLVRTTDSQPWTLVSQGDLYVSQSTIPLRNHQLLGGGLGEPIMRLKFRAQNEDVDVTDIQLTSVGNPISNEVDRLELYKDGESSPFAMATIGGCGSDDVPTTHEGKQVQTFCANTESRQLVVPEGEEIDVLVRSRIKTDVQGAVSGERIQFFVHGRNVSNNATGAGAIRARGDESSNNLSANDEDNKAEGEVFIGTDSVGPNSHITGKENVSVMSKITSITNANENPNGSAVPIGLSDIGKLKFTAASNTNSRNGLNAAEINGIIFNLNATNVLLNASPGNFRVYNPADSTITHNCKTFLNDSTREQVSGEVSGSLLIECKDLSPSAVDTNIYSGNSITLVLQGNVLDQNSSTVGAPSTLQVSLQNFESIERTDFGVENEQHMSHILWRDIDATSLTSFTWIEYPTTTVKSTSYAG